MQNLSRSVPFPGKGLMKKIENECPKPTEATESPEEPEVPTGMTIFSFSFLLVYVSSRFQMSDRGS